MRLADALEHLVAGNLARLASTTFIAFSSMIVD
jgi:hypothetical protein